MSAQTTQSPPRTAMWIGGAVALAVLALVASYLLVIGPQRADAASLATERLEAVQKNEQIVEETARLKGQYATLGERKAELASLLAQFPAEADVPALLTQLSAYSAESGVTVTGVTTTTPVVHAGAAAAATASGPIIVDIPVTLTVAGSFSGTELFVKKIQADMQRTLTVSKVTSTTGSEVAGGAVATEIAATVYVVRDASTPTTTSTTTGGASS